VMPDDGWKTPDPECVILGRTRGVPNLPWSLPVTYPGTFSKVPKLFQKVVHRGSRFLCPLPLPVVQV
jgi:hypothetical protein